ncbi:hypothetical protein RJ639_010328 [Escallonia herrerae]|uniref:HAT C-terminal dimerisation domain-containing protein n=1 Tax=Escallonia herrerae TaxID=1293975 RepID=A0AA88VV81_9ASTE|nr:hypothetical protein RJ639_010328 [Escallonia herrerae]
METPEYEELIDEDENEEPSATPLWKYVTKIYAESSAEGGGGSNKFVCNFGCRSKPYSGSYTRVRYHLSGTIPGTWGLKKKTGINMCSKITRSEREALVQEEVAANQLFGGNSKARKLPAGKSAVPPHPRNDIDKMFRINHREDVDQQIARCMYGNGIPFNVVRSPLWHDMTSAIRLAPAGYVCPNYEKVRTTLLDREYNKTFHSLELLKVKKKTRFGHHFIVLTRLITVRVGLVSMVLSKQWENLRKNGIREEHDNTQQTIMDDDFWRKCERLVKFTKPIYKIIRFFDSDKAIFGEVYEQMDTMLGLIKDELLDDLLVYDLVHDFVVERWDKMNLPLHCLAYVLVPKYYTSSWLSKPAPGGERRKKPHFDIEVQKGYFQALDRLITDPTEAGLVRQQISDFVSYRGVFSQPQAVADRATMEDVAWWDMYGGGAPELHCLALKVLSQSVNSSCAERCWSTYSYIHNVKGTG